MNNEKTLTHIDLFSGIGGFTLAAEWAGFKTVVFCEKEKFCQRVLKKHWPGIPIIKEIRDLDGTKYRGATLLTGGFPCQPFSVAGQRRGKEDDRYLWPEMLRVISEAKPHWILAENVLGIFRMALDTVLADLEGKGYTTGTFIIPACSLNAPHRRNRIWIVANINSEGLLRMGQEKSGKSGWKLEQSKQERRAMGSVNARCDSYAPNSRKQKRNRLSDIGGQKMAEIGREDQNVTNSKSEFRETPRLSSREKSQYSRFRNSHKNENGIIGWEENWYEVAARFCRVFNGISDWLDTQMNDVIYYNHETRQEDFIEGVSSLWEAIQSQKVREKTGGLFQIFDEKNLLSILRKLSEKTEKQSDLSSASDKIQSGSLRNLWKNAEFRCSSRRRRYQEQLAREFKNLVPSLPHESALEIAQVCDEINIAYLSIASDRVHRLKALGNAIVPQIAYEILKNIARIEKELPLP